jgi:long-chain fatty acid transport protein
MGNKSALAVTLVMLGIAQRAQATPAFEAIAGFGGSGGIQPRATGAAVSSTYFNPALLPDAPMGLTVGFVAVNQQIATKLDARPPGVDVPDVNYAQVAPNDYHPVPTGVLNNGAYTPDRNFAPRPRQKAGTGFGTQTYEALGLVLKGLDDRLAFGLYALLPNKSFATFNSFFANEQEQYFSNSLHPELYSDRLSAISVAGALGIRVTDTFSIGLGSTVGIKAIATASAFVADATRLGELNLNINAQAKVFITPHLGLSWKPHKRLHLTGTVHAPQRFDIKAAFAFTLATLSETGSQLGFTYDFLPWQLGAGASVDILQRSDLVVSATGSLVYGRWSKYVDRQGFRPSDAYEWDDTITGALGLRVQRDTLGIGLDGQYKPTPVPLQTGRTNYVDNDRVGLGLTADYGFKVWKLNMKVGALLQGYRLIERHQTKLPTPTFADGITRTPQLVVDEIRDNAAMVGTKKPLAGREGLQTNNPGFPGFASRGWVSSAGLYLTLVL